MRSMDLRYPLTSSRKQKFIVILILSLVIIALLPISALRIRTKEGTFYCPLFSSAITMIISYTHSVSLTKVVDIYKVNSGGIWAVEEKWQQFDAGQPLSFQKMEKGFFIKKLNMFMGKEWKYWFIPLNSVSIKVNSNFIVHDMKKEGIVDFAVVKVPLISILAGGD